MLDNIINCGFWNQETVDESGYFKYLENEIFNKKWNKIVKKFEY